MSSSSIARPISRVSAPYDARKTHAQHGGNDERPHDESCQRAPGPTHEVAGGDREQGAFRRRGRARGRGARRGEVRQLSLEEDGELAEGDLVARPERLRRRHPLPVEEGPVGRAEVAHRPDVALVPDLGLLARHREIVDTDVHVFAASDPNDRARGLVDSNGLAVQEERHDRHPALLTPRAALRLTHRGGRFGAPSDSYL